MNNINNLDYPTFLNKLIRYTQQEKLEWDDEKLFSPELEKAYSTFLDQYKIHIIKCSEGYGLSVYKKSYYELTVTGGYVGWAKVFQSVSYQESLEELFLSVEKFSGFWQRVLNKVERERECN